MTHCILAGFGEISKFNEEKEAPNKQEQCLLWPQVRDFIYCQSWLLPNIVLGYAIIYLILLYSNYFI